MTDKLSPAEIIATHLGWPVENVRVKRFQPQTKLLKLTDPFLYAIGHYYYCVPRSPAELPKGHDWQDMGNVMGHHVYRADAPAKPKQEGDL